MAVIVVLAIGAVVAACGGGDDGSGEDGVFIQPIEATATPLTFVPGSPPAGPTQPPSNTPTSSSTPASSSPTPGANNGSNALTGFAMPIAGGCLPKGDQLMPNAPRTYRNGIHEGVDFYESDNCTAITRNTPVLAAKGGRVIRADVDYKDATQAEINAYLANPNTEDSLDKFRGRQVWIDHGMDASGVRVITRYCHLNGINNGITVGSNVTRGQLIAFVGESGTPESVSRPGSEMHLHFEIRVGDSYLGKGLPPSQVRALYNTAFAP